MKDFQRYLDFKRSGGRVNTSPGEIELQNRQEQVLQRIEAATDAQYTRLRVIQAYRTLPTTLVEAADGR